MMREEDKIRTAEDMERQVLALGFLPFFRCGIPGFSIEERTAWEYWFSDEEEGPWEWKGPVIREGHCAYGKLYNKKAGYVSLEWLPHLMNWRRSRRYAKDDDTQALDDVVLQTVWGEGSVTVKELRSLLGFARGRGRRRDTDLVDTMQGEGRVSLEPVLTRLMMGMHIVIADFEYNIDRHGRPYGWGVARYTTPEALYGRQDAGCTPEESFAAIHAHLCRILPGVSEKKLRELIG
ncbi:hypothetical protein Bacsa_3327 [Phocaeicola salanitronis DSM 18170]|uniref:Uncharacterized protein n=1 Tax=Phocaeicola salanitronis (strain DSM 18170 / JCM 13657 / CCUG 60908 / BL78) TaxID=667015 RepID=F0R5U7_PHOSB|nr:hypothetical protein [Phocaeicola salanitronis]ADY37853.1 hypothetical protein Bacsa_3327 [Phocaeicola salanitronis DSM 18170]